MALVAFMFVFTSCEKEEIANSVNSVSYFIGGEAVAQIGDMDENLKSAPIKPSVGGYIWGVECTYLGNQMLVDGSMFFSGSVAQLDWNKPGSINPYTNNTIWNPVFFAAGSNSSFHITYCPTLPLKVWTKVVSEGSSSSIPSYIGITSIPAPSVENFPLPVKCRRLGDRVRLNAKALTDLPGYSNWSFKLEYVANTIDVGATIAANASTDSEWPTYSYSGSPANLSATAGSADADGDRTIVDVLTYKIGGAFDFDLDGNGTIGAGETGLMKLTIYYDNASIVKYVAPPSLGKSKKITLSTKNVGYHHSGEFNPEELDLCEENTELGV